MASALCGWAPPLLFKHNLLDEDYLYAQDIRQQFVEQVKCLEIRTENQTSLLSEIQDFYKKRADIEADYSKNLDKLNRQLVSKQKTEKQRREGWLIFSLYGHYQQLIEETKIEARNRAALSDLYSNHVSCKLSVQADQLQRISKKCREISVIAQQEITRVLGELHTATKTYQLCQTASWAAENKFRAIKAQKCKFEESNPKKIGSRKHRFLEKEFEKKHAKYADFQLKALKAKNEYLLCIDAANGALHKYFADDLSDLLDCVDVGCEEWLKGVLFTVADCRQAALDADSRHVQSLNDFSRHLDHRVDKRRFLDANHSAFTLPRKFEFRPHASDADVIAPALTTSSAQTPTEPSTVAPPASTAVPLDPRRQRPATVAPCGLSPARVRAHKCLNDEYSQRCWQMNERLMQLKTETEEVWKTLESAEKTLMDIQKQPEVKWSDLFTFSIASSSNASCTYNSQNGPGAVNGGNIPLTANDLLRRNSCRESDASLQKRKQDSLEIEDYYLQKFQEYLITGNLIRRLEARHEAIRRALSVTPPMHCSVGGVLTQNSNGGPSTNRSYSAEGGHSQRVHSAFGSTNQNSVDAASCPSYDHRQIGLESASTHCLPRSDWPVTVNRHDHSSTPSPNQNSTASQSSAAARTRRRKRIGVSASSRARERLRPKLFGGSVDEFFEATGEEVPLIIRSCVRMLSLYGLHHQGVFRVSGSQIEINGFKDSFERGEDPLANVTDSSDVNSVAGVLKLYFRELREPLFPIFMFDQFVECSSIENKETFSQKVQELVLTLPRSVFVVMRYIFAFLNHLSEYSDENMMDPYNLAICFGPTLLPIPESRDQVFYHNHVNELMKNMIIHHEEIFPKNGDGSLLYEKYLLATDDQSTLTNSAKRKMSADRRLEKSSEAFESMATAAKRTSINQNDEGTLENKSNLSRLSIGQYDTVKDRKSGDGVIERTTTAAKRTGAVDKLRSNDGLVPNSKNEEFERTEDEDEADYSRDEEEEEEEAEVDDDEDEEVPESQWNHATVRDEVESLPYYHKFGGESLHVPTRVSDIHVAAPFGATGVRQRSVSDTSPPAPRSPSSCGGVVATDVHASLRSIDSPFDGDDLVGNALNVDLNVWRRRTSITIGDVTTANNSLQYAAPISGVLQCASANPSDFPAGYTSMHRSYIAMKNPILQYDGNGPSYNSQPCADEPQSYKTRGDSLQGTPRKDEQGALRRSLQYARFSDRDSLASMSAAPSLSRYSPSLAQEVPADRSIKADTHAIYANMHTSLTNQCSAKSTTTRSPQLSPNSLCSSSCSSRTSFKQPVRPDSSTSDCRKSDVTGGIHSALHDNEFKEAGPKKIGHAFGNAKSSLEGLTLRQYQGYPTGYTFSNGGQEPTAAPKTQREGAIAALQRLSLNSYPSSAGSGAKSQVARPPVATQPSPPSPSPKMCRSVNAALCLDECVVVDTDEKNLVSHYPPKGLSPSSLKEIQVELKAVLSSLETFTSQNQKTPSCLPRFDADEVERRFGLGGFTTAADMDGRKSVNKTAVLNGAGAVSPPDLVQNLPLPGTKAVALSAQRPSEERSIDFDSIGRSRMAKSLTVSQNPSAKPPPPLPRKPSGSSSSSPSPQIARRAAAPSTAAFDSDAVPPVRL